MNSSDLEQDIEKIAQGGTLMAIGLAFTNLASFAFVVILARVLGPSGYGIFVLGFSIFGFVSAISLMGMDSAILRFIAPIYAKGNSTGSRFILTRIVSYSMVLSIGMTLIMYTLADFIAIEIFDKKDVLDIIRIFSLCVVPFVFSVLGYSALQSTKNIKQQVISRNFIEPCVKLLGVTLLLILPTLWPGWPVVVVGISFLVAAIYSWLQLTKILGKSSPIRNIEWSDRDMLVYSLPLFLTAAFNMGLFRLDVLFLGHFASAAEVGIYGAAFLTANLGIFGLTIANLVFSPYIAASYHNNELAKLKLMFRTVSRWILILTLPFIAVVFLYSGQILSIYGEQFSSGKPVLLILSSAITIANVLGVSGPVLVMSGRSWSVLVNTIVTSIFAIAAFYLLVPKYGMIGASVAAALAICLMAILRFTQVYRFLKITPFDSSSLKPILAAFVALVPLVVVDWFIYSPENWKGIIVPVILYLVLYIYIMNYLGWRKEDAQAFQAVSMKFHLRMGK